MTNGGRAMVVAGLAAHVLLLPVFLASGLVVPWWAVGALVAVWVVALVAALRNRDRPAVVLAAPAVALIVLVAVVTAGEQLFDWTA